MKSPIKSRNKTTARVLKQNFSRLKIGAVEKMPGYLHVDIDPSTKPDVVADVEKLPFKNDTFEHVIMDSVLEHVDMFNAMREIHRVCKNKAIIEIWMPHWSSSHTWAHLQHKRGGSYFMFSDTRGKEYGFDFDVVHSRILVEGRQYPYQKGGFSRWHLPFRLIEKIANRFPQSFERIWCHWVGGAEGLYFKLKVKK